MAEVTEEIIQSAEGLAACCAYLAGCPVIGLDTEFVGEETYHPRLCLVQVATPERLFLIDPFATGPLDAFWPLLLDPARVVVVHAGREEVRLCRLWSGQVPANLFDLQIAAGLVGLTYPLGHGPLVNQLLGVRLSKGGDAHGVASPAADARADPLRLRRRPLPAPLPRQARRPAGEARPGRLGAGGVRPPGRGRLAGRPRAGGALAQAQGHRLAGPPPSSPSCGRCTSGARAAPPS